MRKVTMVALRFFHAHMPLRERKVCSVLDKEELLNLLEGGPVIASVKNDQGLDAALESDVPVIFLLYGDVLTVGELTRRAHEAGKVVFVHLDLVDGLASREICVDFIAHNTVADGVLSTKASMSRRAKELGLLSVQRFFLLDSMAIESIQKHHAQDTSDLIEVLPGLMPKIIRQVKETVNKPVIAGGLIRQKEDVTAALAAGAVAVSATSPEVWAM